MEERLQRLNIHAVLIKFMCTSYTKRHDHVRPSSARSRDRATGIGLGIWEDYLYTLAKKQTTIHVRGHPSSARARARAGDRPRDMVGLPIYPSTEANNNTRSCPSV